MSEMEKNVMSWLQRLKDFFALDSAAKEDVIPDNVYNSCWKDSPIKEQIAGASDEDRGTKNPCVYSK
jgi:hypothetical protein